MAKRASIEFVVCADLESTAARFGGEPFGLPLPLWPVSRRMNEPMQFICQIPLQGELFPEAADAVAYLFMTSGSDGEETWAPDSGENALVLVPREDLTNSVTVGDAPRLCRMVKKPFSKRLSPETCTYSAHLTFCDDPEFIPAAELMGMPDEHIRVYQRTLGGNKLGGTPGFLQSDELPIPEPWYLLMQLDSARVPFWINFGDAGVGYAFINRAGTEGKFLWQCC